MNFPLFVARRYLFSKKSHNAINFISAISVGGVALATLAMVCTLSVFNGFRDLIGSLYTAFDPELQVVPAKGKFMQAGAQGLSVARSHPDVEAASACLEDHAMLLFAGRPVVITLKGVDENFEKSTGIRSILYGEGEFVLSAAGVEYGVPGIGLAGHMGGVDYGSLQVCAPRRGEQLNMTNPGANFNAGELLSPGVVFSVSQRKYDENYLLASLSFAQNLFEQPGNISSLELKLKPGTDTEKVKADLRQRLGKDFRVLDQAEQQEEVFGIMAIEKLIAYFFLTFIVLVACFNIIGSVSMLIIDKRDDVATLRTLGANDRLIVRIFLFEGRFISVLGAIIGVVLGLLLCWAQQTFGLLRLGESSGSFIIEAYPVSVHWQDVLAVFATVIAVGFLSVWYPVHYLSKRLL